MSQTSTPNGWMRPAGIVSLIVAGLSGMASATFGSGGPDGVLIAVATNPLVFIGLPLGLYWLAKSRSPVTQSNAGRFPSLEPLPLPVPPNPVPPPRPAPSPERAPTPVVASSLSPQLGCAGIILGIILLATTHFIAFSIGTSIERNQRQTAVGESSAPQTAVAESSAPPMASTRGKYWSIGATIEDVAGIEGDPERIFSEGGNIVWRYNVDDHVTFDSTRKIVVAWKNPKKSLAVTVNSKDPPPPLDPKAPYRFGSSFEEVLRAIGMPNEAESRGDGGFYENWIYTDENGRSCRIRFAGGRLQKFERNIDSGSQAASER